MILMVDDLMVDDLMCWWSNHQPSKFGVPMGTQGCLGNCGSHMEPGTQSCLDNSKVAGCSDSHGVGMKLFSYSKLFMVQRHSFLNRADWLAHSHSTSFLARIIILQTKTMHTMYLCLLHGSWGYVLVEGPTLELLDYKHWCLGEFVGVNTSLHLGFKTHGLL